jgi:tetratricopeptide (TPR) repeat protein
MFTTSQFRVFTSEPEEKALIRPRRLLRDGDRTQAEAAYLEVLAEEPGLKAAWAEYFQLLRAEGRLDEALELAERAVEQFGGDAFSGALKGAALVEMGRLRPALKFLQASAEMDPDFGMVWHEMGYAAYRLGEFSHALLALDRAFALDPRSGTLHLRGKILRTSGQFMAAEVAFAGAAEAAEYPEQRAEAERQIAITRRYGLFARRPGELSGRDRWFAEHGTVFLTRPDHGTVPDDTALEAFANLARQQVWRFTALMAVDDWPGWARLAQLLNIPVEPELRPAFGMIPLVVARQPDCTNARWVQGNRAIAGTGAGLTFVLDQRADQPAADVAFRLEGEPAVVDLGAAALLAEHEEGRLVSRRLR